MIKMLPLFLLSKKRKLAWTGCYIQLQLLRIHRHQLSTLLHLGIHWLIPINLLFNLLILNIMVMKDIVTYIYIYFFI